MDRPHIESSPHPSPTRRTLGKWAWRLLVLAIIAGIGVLVWPALNSLDESKKAFPQFVTGEVTQKPFRIAVTDRGTIDSMKNATLISNVEGTTTIIWIAPEGTDVKEGELVCELDSSSLIDKEKQQRILVTQAEADLKKATENVAIQKTQNESDLAAADLALDLAVLDLEKFEKGEAIQADAEFESEVQLSQEKLNQAQANYEFALRLSKKGYKALNEVETLGIAVTDAQLKLEIAKGKLKVQREYTYKRTIKQLKVEADEAVRDRERVERSGKAALARYEADLQAAELTYEVESGKLTKLREQIAACKLYAPQNGKVVYASQQSRRSEPVVIEEGATVRERQAIIKLPDFTQMKADARIHESRISQIREGLPVEITVDALPDMIYHGVLDHVSDVPVPGSWPNYDLKEYEAEVRIIEDDLDRVQQLKPGMTAGLEILVEEGDEDVLQAPIQSIISIGEKCIAYVLNDQVGPERRDVQIGRTNDTAVEVLSGLNPGEKVILNPRTHFADEISGLEAKYGAAQAAKNGKKRFTPPRLPLEPNVDANAATPAEEPAGKTTRPKKASKKNDLKNNRPKKKVAL